MGIRRSSEELNSFKSSNNSAKYSLCEQTSFNGTKEDLLMMQDYERAYIDGQPKISDEEWDILKKRYNYEESLVAGARSGRTWVKLQAPLPSIKKVSTEQEIRDYINKFNRPGRAFLVENKLDGLTADVFYRHCNGYYMFDKITTRGNGRYGLEINNNALSGVITNIPLTIDEGGVRELIKDYKRKTGQLNVSISIPETLELRGEAVVPKFSETYKRYGKAPVWRNIASGIFNRKNPQNLPGIMKIYNIFPGDNYDNEARKAIIGLTNSFSDVKFKNKKSTGIEILQDCHTVKITEGDVVSKVTIPDEYLDIVFYSVAVDGSNFDSPNISSLGVKTVDDIKFEDSFNGSCSKTYTKICGNNDYVSERIIDKVNEFYGINKKTGKRDSNLPRLRNEYEYACDGVVIKPSDSSKFTQDLEIRSNKSNKNKVIIPKYPEDTIAVKYLSEVVHVTLAKIVENKTDLGNVTYTGELDHEYVTESGAKVKNINLHNGDWLRENSWIHEGGDYDMCMSMDIIPVLLKP